MKIKSSTMEHFDVFAMDIPEFMDFLNSMRTRGNQDARTEHFEWSLETTVSDVSFTVEGEDDLDALKKDMRVPSALKDFRVQMYWSNGDTSRNRRSVALNSDSFHKRPSVYITGLGDDEAWRRQIAIDISRHLQTRRRRMFWAYRPAITKACVIVFLAAPFVSMMLGILGKSLPDEESYALLYVRGGILSLWILVSVLSLLRRRFVPTSSIQIREPKKSLITAERLVVIIAALTLAMMLLQLLLD